MQNASAKCTGLEEYAHFERRFTKYLMLMLEAVLCETNAKKLALSDTSLVSVGRLSNDDLGPRV